MEPISKIYIFLEKNTFCSATGLYGKLASLASLNII